MKTKKMLLITILLLMVSPSSTVQARKLQQQSVDVEQANQLSWNELKRSLLGIPDSVEGFRCCQIANGLIYQLKDFERNPELKVYEKVYPGGDPEIEAPICESIESAFEKDTGIKIYFYTKVEEDKRIRLRVMRLEALTEGEEDWI